MSLPLDFFRVENMDRWAIALLVVLVAVVVIVVVSLSVPSLRCTWYGWGCKSRRWSKGRERWPTRDKVWWVLGESPACEPDKEADASWGLGGWKPGDTNDKVTSVSVAADTGHTRMFAVEENVPVSKGCGWCSHPYAVGDKCHNADGEVGEPRWRYWDGQSETWLWCNKTSNKSAWQKRVDELGSGRTDEEKAVLDRQSKRHLRYCSAIVGQSGEARPEVGLARRARSRRARGMGMGMGRAAARARRAGGRRARR